MSIEVEQYNHHGADVWVRSDLKGRHREHCLCFACGNLHVNTPANCTRAQELFELCQRLDMVTPVWECPAFIPK